ncbi:hypothetical protein ACFL4G_04395 [Thermodesulfobacteriota bacterium]
MRKYEETISFTTLFVNVIGSVCLRAEKMDVVKRRTEKNEISGLEGKGAV